MLPANGRISMTAAAAPGTYIDAESGQPHGAHDRARGRRGAGAGKPDQRRSQHHAVEPAVAAIGGADEHRCAGGMSDGEQRRRTIRQHDLAHESFEVGVVFGEVAHETPVAVLKPAIGKSLAAPIQRRYGKSARAQVAHGLEVFFDPFATALKDAHGAAPSCRRLPTRKAQRDAVRRLQAIRDEIIRNRIGGDRDELHGEG